MTRALRFLAGLALVISAATPAADFGAHRLTLDQYCVTCHNEALQVAGLSLQHLAFDDVATNAKTWERVLRKLKARAMPPAGIPRPEDPVYASMAAYIETELDDTAKRLPWPGRPSLRRLNRTEYVNSIRELVAIDIDGERLLPPDDAMFGFDNIGSVLTLSPLLIERYVAAAREVRQQALGDPDIAARFTYYELPETLLQDDRMSEELPYGSRGGIAVKHHFPADGEYVIQLRLQRNYRDYIRGLVNREHRLDVRIDGERVRLFTFGGEKHGRSSGLYSTSAQGDVAQEQYERYADQTLEVRFMADAGPQLVTAAFLQENVIAEGPLVPRQTRYDYTQYKGGNPALRTLAIGGPFESLGAGQTESRQRILTCQPLALRDELCAREILTRLARQAYRRPPRDDELEVLLEFYRDAEATGGFEAGIGRALERLLAGPEFLFIAERIPAGTGAGELYRISDLELASGLSFFIWSQIPDNELLTLAEAGQLSEPDVFSQQVRRMLDDPRSGSLIENFAAQWLTLGKLNVAAPDIEIFPYFDENLRRAFRKETELFIEHVMREDRPLLELLTADYSFINDRLARHYGIPDVHGSHFRKVTLADAKRGGLLGHGSILTVTSYANRTAPTIRGKWILENVLSSPPPPPPPNVPGLRETNAEGLILSMRERMEQHRSNPVCASCHKVMDPLGFALENYDAIGTWRTVDGSSGAPIDAAGTLPDGTAFEGPVELRSVLSARRRDDFIHTVVEKLMTYALGREITHHDAPFVRAVIRETAPLGHSLPALIMAVANSTPFQMRRVSEGDYFAESAAP